MRVLMGIIEAQLSIKTKIEKRTNPKKYLKNFQHNQDEAFLPPLLILE
jgi:hypothetical protein